MPTAVAGWTTNADTPIGKIRGLKCGGVDGKWTVRGEESLGVGTVTTLWSITIDGETLAGTFHHKKVQKLGPSVTTSDQSGKARIVKNRDGSVMMTVDPAKITLTTVGAYGTASFKIDGAGRVFLWEPAAAGECP